ncbi:hypothetical protein H5410_028490 [Solanum commersonii]|uniref:Uncharacterized protein n=1 Tax=Solanum commersonii TaxID=4109 RepID=A0A9J5Z7N9_SOLCO|nr:hypothetical protein H5410_028490 [Solanum commersonii]
MRMLRWMYSHTRSDKIRNEDIQRKKSETEMVGKCVDAPVMRCKSIQGQIGVGIWVRVSYRSNVRVESRLGSRFPIKVSGVGSWVKRQDQNFYQNLGQVQVLGPSSGVGSKFGS